MTRNLKLGIAGIGFLGVNGTLIPTLINNWNFSNLSLDNLFRGGGHFS